MDESIIQDLEKEFQGKVFLKIEDVSVLLGCTKKVVYNWTRRVDRERRPPRVSVGKTILFPKKEFIRWLVREQSV